MDDSARGAPRRERKMNTAAIQPAFGTEGTEETGSDDNIKVFVRIRPLGGGSGTMEEVTRCANVVSNTTIALNNKEEKKFTYDGVKDEGTTQEEIFSTVGRAVLDNCMKGYNGTIFAYGQTGSGKTYTMTGLLDEENNIIEGKRGLMPRCFEHLFSLVGREVQKKGDRMKYLVTCSFLEIYNERIFDLLDAGCTGKQLREDVKRGVTIPDLTELTVRNSLEACEVLKAGSSNRRVGSTSMNRESSRSHAVFTVVIKSLESDGDLTNIKEAKLHMIDLAGSERQRSTNADGERLKEAGNINKSLSALGNVIMALVDVANGLQRHVAYRDSKLTFLLRDSLGGNTKTFMIANISPAAQSFGETLSTLQFAQRAKMIKNKARVNENTAGNIKVLQAEIQRLKEMLQKGGPQGVPQAVPAVSGPMDGNQQQLFIAALKSRDDAERGRAAAIESEELARDKAMKLEKAVQSTKMIVKFRDSALAKLRKASSKDVDNKDAKDHRIADLEAELAALQEMNRNHPEVTRFAMRNLALQEKVKEFELAYPNHAKENQELASARAYTLMLEQHIVQLTENGSSVAAPPEMPVTPVAKRTRGITVAESDVLSPRAKRSADVELEKFKLEKESEAKIQELKAQLEQDQIALTNVVKAAEQRETELQAELSGANKSLKELETTIRVLQIRQETEITRLKDEHMLRLQKAQAAAADAARDSAAEAQIAALEEELVAQGAHASSVNKQLDESHLTISRLQQDLNRAEGKSTVLSERCTQLETELNEAKEHANDISSTLTSDLEAVNIMLEDHKAELETLRSQNIQATQEHEVKLAKLKSDLELAHQDAEELEEEATAALAKKEQVEAELEAERTQRLNIADELENLRSEADFKEDESRRKDEIHAEVKKQLSSAQSTVGLLEKEVENLKTTLSEASGADVDAQDALAAAVVEVEERERELRAAYDNQSTIVADLESRVSELDRELQKDQAALKAHVETVATLKIDLADARETASAKTAELAEMSDSVKALEHRSQEDEKTITELKQSLSHKEQELIDEHAASQEQVQGMLQEMSSMHEALKKASDERNAFETAFSEYKNTAEPILAAAEQNTAELEAIRSANATFEATVSRLQAELDSVSAEMSKENSDRHFAHQTEVANLKKQCEDAAELLRTTESFKEAKIAEIAALRSEISDLKEKQVKLEESDHLCATLKAKSEESAAALAQAEQKIAEQTKKHQAVEELRQKTETDLKKQLEKLEAEKRKIDTRRELCEHNLDAALEDAEALVDELQRSRMLENSLYQEKEELKSKFEQSQESTLRAEEELATTQHKLTSLRAELDKMMAHNNPNQKIQLHMAIKRENNDLKKEIDKLKLTIKQKDNGAPTRSVLGVRNGDSVVATK